MKIYKVVSDYINANVFVLKKETQCLIVDCGADVGDVKKIVGDCSVVGVLLTHGHYDHSRYFAEYAKTFNCQVYANCNIIDTLVDADAIYSPNGEIINDCLDLINLIDKDKQICLGGFKVDCYSCPGHCKCCECYVVDKNLFAGDVLFENGIGRIDLKSSNKDDMLKSLIKLEYIKYNGIYSGHGNESTYDIQQKNISVFKRFLLR